MHRGNFIGGLLAVLLMIAVSPMADAASLPTPTAPPPPPPVRVTPTKPPIRPPVMVIRPSQAAMIAQRAFMGAKVLGVKPKGGKYIVTLKLKDKVKQAVVDGTTGALK